MNLAAVVRSSVDSVVRWVAKHSSAATAEILEADPLTIIKPKAYL